MKRLAFVLAAAVLGTGCGSSHPPCPPSTVTVPWNFQLSDGTITNCAGAGVSQVDLFVNGNPVSTSPCTDGRVVIATGTAGIDAFTVEGIDAFGRIAYRDQFNAQSIACGDNVVPTTPAEGIVSVNYHLSPVDSCASPGPTYMWLAVRDDVAGQTAFIVNGGSADNTCGAALSYRLPIGSFTFKGIEEMQFNGGTSYSALATDCTQRPFDIAAASTTIVSPVLVDSNFACTTF